MCIRDRVYTDDKTYIKLGNEIENVEIEVTSGIKQGCTGSTTLFKLVTYKIIKELEKEKGFNNGSIKINSLFFADDGLILAESVNDAAANIRTLLQISGECGLEINKEKSNVLTVSYTHLRAHETPEHLVCR